MTNENTALVPVEKAVKAFLPSLQGNEMQRAVTLVNKGFDPGFHLVIYQNRVMVTIDGHQWWLRRLYPGARIISKPVPGPEREAYGVGEDEIGVIASIYLPGIAEPVVTGFGRASKDSQRPVSRGSAVEANHPYRMAEKRAEAQAIRKIAPIGIMVTTPEEAQDNIVEGEAHEIPAREDEQRRPLA